MHDFQLSLGQEERLPRSPQGAPRRLQSGAPPDVHPQETLPGIIGSRNGQREEEDEARAAGMSPRRPTKRYSEGPCGRSRPDRTRGLTAATRRRLSACSMRRRTCSMSARRPSPQAPCFRRPGRRILSSANMRMIERDVTDRDISTSTENRGLLPQRSQSDQAVADTASTVKLPKTSVSLHHEHGRSLAPQIPKIAVARQITDPRQ